MSMPSSSSPVWNDLITGKKQVTVEFLATKIFLGRAQMNYKNDPSTLAKLAAELYALFEKNQNLPSVQRDIEQLK